MRCRVCGAEMKVRETRCESDGFIVRRVRECSNGHRYQTMEIDDSLKLTIFRKAERRDRIAHILARIGRWHRNREISRRAQTEKLVVLASEYGLTETMISYIARGRDE